MLTRETLLLAAEAVSKECRAASEAGDIDRLIDHADALKAITTEINDQRYYIVDELERGLVNFTPMISPIDGRGVA
jgi:DNA-directed RNA polymerase